MPTSLPTITLNRRRFYIVRAGLPVRDVLEQEHQHHRRALTCHHLFGPWRLLVTGPGWMYSDRHARFISRTTATPRRAR